MLSTIARENTASHAVQYQQAVPFRHVLMTKFFEPAFCQRLLTDFPDFDKQHALNEMGEVGGKAVRMDVRDISPAYRELDAWLQTTDFLSYVSRLTGIPDLLYDPDYIGGGSHENRDGQSLDTHVDFNYHPRTHWHRRLNLIVYLNRDWDEAWGGCLDLHADPWHPQRDQMVRVPPLFNHCAIFETTERSWHGFDEIRLPQARQDISRKSFAIYLYTRERPAQETAPPHATIYVPQGMPDWQAGRVLDGDDLHELNKRFTRMRSQLRYLYDREKDFGDQINGYAYALREARAAQRLNLQGYANQSEPPQGLWPDNWAGAEVVFTFSTTRKTKALELVLWSPPALGTGQQLHIQFGDVPFTKKLRPGMSTPLVLPLKLPAEAQVKVTIRADKTWVPAQQGDSADERALAYRILSAALKH